MSDAISPTAAERARLREILTKFDHKEREYLLITAFITLSECRYHGFLDQGYDNGTLIIVLLESFITLPYGGLRLPEKNEEEVFARWLKREQAIYDAVVDAPELSDEDVHLVGWTWAGWLDDGYATLGVYGPVVPEENAPPVQQATAGFQRLEEVWQLNKDPSESEDDESEDDKIEPTNDDAHESNPLKRSADETSMEATNDKKRRILAAEERPTSTEPAYPGANPIVNTNRDTKGSLQAGKDANKAIIPEDDDNSTDDTDRVSAGDSTPLGDDSGKEDDDSEIDDTEMEKPFKLTTMKSRNLKRSSPLEDGVEDERPESLPEDCLSLMNPGYTF